jgi:PAS domain S-box-containing protein
MRVKQPLNNLEFLNGGGEMGELTRSNDWSKTSLGVPGSWPQSLRTTISILLHSGFPIVLFWGPELICFYNDAFRPSLGKEGKHPRILGMKGEDAWQEIWPTIKPWIDEVLNENKAIWNEDLLLPIYRNGKIEDVYWTFSYSPVSDETGKPAGVFVSVVETTGKVRAFKQLAESELRFRTMAEASDILIGMSDETGNATYFNKAWEKLTGRPMEDLLMFGWADLIHPDDRENFLNIYVSAFRLKMPFSGEFRILNRNGDYRWVLTQGPPLFRSDGSFAGYISSAMDITEQKLALCQVEESEEDLRNLVLHAPIGICVLGAESLTTEIVNDRFVEITGKPLDEIAGKYYWDTFRETRPYYETELARVVKEGTSFFANEVKLGLIRHGKEEMIYVTFVYSPLKDKSGKVKNVAVWVLENTTQVMERQKVEELVAERTKELEKLNENLKKSEERYHLMVEEVQDYAILYLTPEGIVENWNLGAEKIKGYKANEIIGKSYST